MASPAAGEDPIRTLLATALLACTLVACGDKEGDSADTSCTEAPTCPEGENTLTQSDVPCGTDDGDESTIEEGCQEVTACDETVYCRPTGV